jgi:hypothetical protein
MLFDDLQVAEISKVWTRGTGTFTEPSVVVMKM